jgi:hypothetical protein
MRLGHSILYAKVILHIKDRAMDKAEEQLKLLIKAPTAPFKTVLSAINQYFCSVSETLQGLPAKIGEIFKMLSSRHLR